jgi:hypothetical protein
MDGSLLYQRTFLDTDHRTLMEYIQFWLSTLGGWFVGYFLVRKIVEKYKKKYTLNYTFRVSLLIASMSLWTQYKSDHHAMERLFSQLVINNVYCSLFLGLLSYSIISIMNEKNELEHMKKQKIYTAVALGLGFLYSWILTDDRLGSGFLLSTVVYFVAYLFFLKTGLNNLDYEIRVNSIIPMTFTCIIIIIGMILVHFKVLQNFTFISEDGYPVVILVGFIIFEMTQYEKYRVEEQVKEEVSTVKLEKETEVEKKKLGIGKKK